MKRKSKEVLREEVGQEVTCDLKLRDQSQGWGGVERNKRWIEQFPKTHFVWLCHDDI